MLLFRCRVLEDLMYKNISYSELKKLTSPLLLDVRQIYEFEEFALEGALLIPLNEIADRIDELASYQEHEIVVYCKAGIRSVTACKILAGFGFNKLYNLASGINEFLR